MADTERPDSTTDAPKRGATKIALLGIFCLLPIAAWFGRRLERGYPELSLLVPLAGFCLFMLHVSLHSLLVVRSIATSSEISGESNKQAALFALLGMIVTPLIVVGMSTYLVDFPIERIHILKYGLLAYLIVAIQSRTALPKRLLVAFVLAGVAGTLEETSQIWIPERRFDFRDLLLNLFSVFTGTLYAASMNFAKRCTSSDNIINS